MPTTSARETSPASMLSRGPPTAPVSIGFSSIPVAMTFLQCHSSSFPCEDSSWKCRQKRSLHTACRHQLSNMVYSELTSSWAAVSPCKLDTWTVAGFYSWSPCQTAPRAPCSTHLTLSRPPGFPDDKLPASSPKHQLLFVPTCSSRRTSRSRLPSLHVSSHATHSLGSIKEHQNGGNEGWLFRWGREDTKRKKRKAGQLSEGKGFLFWRRRVNGKGERKVKGVFVWSFVKEKRRCRGI